MSKNAVTDWDTTPGNNGDISGVNIAEGCAASGINDAIRSVMAQIATWIAATTGPVLKVAGLIPSAQQVADAAGTGRAIGFRGFPVSRSVTAATALTLNDADMIVSSTTGALNIPLNSVTNFPVGFVAGFYNNSGSSNTITGDVGVTLRLEGTATTGTRTIAQRSRGFVWQCAVNEWIVSGMAIS